MVLNVFDFVFISIVLYLIGIWGVIVVRSNLLIILMSIELMLFSISLNFIGFSAYFDDLLGQLFALFILSVAAAESAIGLAILVVYYRLRGVLDLEYISVLKA
jgi:NADH-quinone oxidoreductase subunit K